VDKVKHDAELRFKKELDIERNFLDSLLNKSLLSNEGYNWYIQKLQFKKEVEKAHNDLLSRNEVKTIISKDVDSLLKYHSFRRLVTTISSAFYDRKVKRIITSNSNLQDYRIVYDSILRSNLFSDKANQILLFETSDWLIQNNKATEISKHLEKIKKDIKDTVLVSYLIDKYNLENHVSNELQLADINGNKTTLSNIIKSNTNKVIYVDFWASWCGPCIEEFSQSKILTEKLKDNNVEFIYLSIDEASDKWIASSKKNLPSKHSFLIKNVKTSKFLESIDLSLIPRYLIFDKTGNLKYTNAPRPSNNETIKILRELM
jgi:thiol-disulfide isomerase/thioredoxin